MEKKTLMDVVVAFFETYGKTLAVGLVACICVGILVELFKKGAFTSLENKFKDNEEKLATLGTVKATSALVLAGILTAFFLGCIWKSDLPKLGNGAVLPIHFTVMYLLQLIFDLKTLKGIVDRILNKIEKKDEAKPAKKKMKKVVTWVEDTDDEKGDIVQ